jgi:DNA-binding transcriptional MerR regulator
VAAPLLNIAALSRRTSVAPDTLRKWEQRYGVLRPARTVGGQRRYTETDVQRVEWLRDRIRDGWRIGEAARVLDETGAAAFDEPGELRDALIASVRESQPQVLSAMLDQAFAVLPLEEALSEVITPALRWTGEAWHRGELSIAQEHALTA